MQFIPVTPKAVRMQLLDSFYPENRRGLFRLFSVAAEVYGDAKASNVGLAKCFSRDEDHLFSHGEFVLIPPVLEREFRNQLTLRFGEPLLQLIAAHVAAFKKWQWLQYRITADGKAVVLWDATQDAGFPSKLRPMSIANMILGAFFCPSGSSWETVKTIDQKLFESVDEAAGKEPAEGIDLRTQPWNHELKPAIITSFGSLRTIARQ